MGGRAFLALSSLIKSRRTISLFCGAADCLFLPDAAVLCCLALFPVPAGTMSGVIPGRSPVLVSGADLWACAIRLDRGVSTLSVGAEGATGCSCTEEAMAGVP